MELRYLQLENFLSFKNLEHTFVNEPVLIKGKNLTEIESKETNGAGKSTMMAGIAYAILATPLRKQTLDRDLITWGEEEANIWLDIYCPIRKETLNIHRTLRIKGSASLELTINEEPDSVKFGTLSDGNAFILKWIGISADDLKNYYIINKENFKSFVSSSNTDKLSLISRFIKAEQLDDADDLIKERNKPLEAQAKTAEANKNRIEGELSVYNEQLAAERERNLEEEKLLQIESINDRIDETVNEYDRAEENIKLAQTGIKSSKETIRGIQKKIDHALKELENLESVDYRERYQKINEERQSTDNKVEELRAYKQTAQKNAARLELGVNRLSAILKGTVTCPKCSHEFLIQDPEKSVAQIKKEIKDCSIHIDKEKKVAENAIESLNKLSAKIKKFDDETCQVRLEEQGTIRAIREVESTISKLKGEVQRTQQLIKNFEAEISDNEKKKERCERESEALVISLDKLEAEELKTREEELEGLVTLTTKKLRKAEAEFEKIQKRISDNVQWGVRFKEFKMSLACEQLRIIQNFANLALQKQRSELLLSIEGFKRDSKGRIKSEITVSVINGEGEYKSFWSFSGGERARIEVALIQAIQEMINGTNEWGGLHFLTIDEVLEGTDPLGLALLLESLEGVGYPVYVISHVMNIRAGVRTLTVVKENGNSYIDEK